MNVLQVMGGFPVDYNGGITNYIRSLINGLTNNKINVIILDSNRNINNDFSLEKKHRHYTIINSPINTFKYERDYNKISYPLIENLFKDIIKSEKIDLVHFHSFVDLSFSLIKVAKQEGCKVIVSLHDYYLLCDRITLLNNKGSLCQGPINNNNYCKECRLNVKINMKLPRMVTKIIRFYSRYFTLNNKFGIIRYDSVISLLNNFSDLNIAVSNSVKKIYQSNGINNIVVNHIGNISYYNNHSNVLGKKVNYGIVGSFHKHKGASVIVDALRLLNKKRFPINVLFFGRSDNYYLNKVNNLKYINFKNCGPYKQDQIADVFSKINVMIFVPIWYDNGPQVVMEAVNYGVPVICSNIGGAPDFIKNNENGIVIESNNHRELAKTIEAIEEGSINLKKIINNGKLKSPEVHCVEIIEMYNSLIHN